MLRVALHRRGAAARLYRRAAFVWLCAEFVALVTRDRERAEAAGRRRAADRLEMGYLAHYALLAPKRLDEEAERLRRAAAGRDRPATADQVAAAKAAGVRLLGLALAAGLVPGGPPAPPEAAQVPPNAPPAGAPTGAPAADTA